MSGIITTKYSEAAAEAIREALKAQKRAKLQKEIDNWNKELSKIKPIRSRLIKEQSFLSRLLSEWEIQKNKCEGNLILSEIVLVNRFEGECADQIKEDFTACVVDMNNTYLNTGTLRDDDGAQITKLDQYISFINNRITSLTNEKNAI